MLSLVIDQDDFVGNGGVRKLQDFIYSASKLFANIDEGSCGSTRINFEFNEELGLKIFGMRIGTYVNWIHILSPSVYLEYYKKEDLLDAPAYKIEEWANDVIMIMSYEDPFSLDDPDTRQRIINLHTYLVQKAKLVQW